MKRARKKKIEKIYNNFINTAPLDNYINIIINKTRHVIKRSIRKDGVIILFNLNGITSMALTFYKSHLL